MLLGTPASDPGSNNTITVVVLKNDAAAASVAVENGGGGQRMAEIDGKKRDTAVTLNPRSINDTR